MYSQTLVKDNIEILALGSRTHDELGSSELTGRSRDDTLDFLFHGHTCQSMTMEEDDPQLGSRALGFLYPLKSKNHY